MDKISQTETPYDFMTLPDKAALVERFKGKSLDGLRTPAMVIDRSIFADNCAKMHVKATEWGAGFRAHLKTHKTSEGTKLQLDSSANKTTEVVVSTLMEAWSVAKSGLVKEGIVKDILYGLPVGANKIQDLAALWDAIEGDGGIVRLLVDHPVQVKLLEEFESKRSKPRKWSAFVKIDGEQKRAGVPPKSEMLVSLLNAMFVSSAVEVYGFYGHAGNSYASKSYDEASSFLSGEVLAVNEAASVALKVLESLKLAPSKPFVLSVGSTPTAHSAGAEAKSKITSLLHGKLELHAGNYPMLDLQQQSTSLISKEAIAQRVRATVISLYPGRGANGTDEAIVDGGALAFSKDSGPSGIYGEIHGKNWQLARMSQEHGILTRTKTTNPASPEESDKLEIGEVLDIVGQHACLIAAAYPWYYIVDRTVSNGEEIVDVWVPWKGW